jgi:hypothetical protein
VARLEGVKRYLVGAVDRIEIVGQAAFIHKKIAVDRIEALRVARPHVEAARDWANWLSFSQQLLEAGGDGMVVVEALRRAIELNRQAIVTYHRLSEALVRIRNADDAIRTLKDTAVVAQNDPAILSDLRNRISPVRNVHL